MLRSPTIIVDLSISPLSFVSFCFMYFETWFLGSYTFMIVMSLSSIELFIMMNSNIPYSEIYFVINIATPPFLLVVFA